MERTYNPCDNCEYSVSKQNQESGMCKICEFKKKQMESSYMGIAQSKFKAELDAYKTAEEQGLLLMPPVYIGQTVYRINEGAENPIIPMAVISIQYNGLTKPFNKIFCKELGFGGEWDYRFTNIGKTLFLTREEAEAALAEKGTGDAKEE